MRQKTPEEKRRKFWTERLDIIASKLDALMREIENLASAVEGNVMKKTTQRSPEWWGAANR